MNEKEKAKELVEKFQKETDLFTGNRESHSTIHAKRCATIAVDEICGYLLGREICFAGA